MLSSSTHTYMYTQIHTYAHNERSREGQSSPINKTGLTTGDATGSNVCSNEENGGGRPTTKKGGRNALGIR